MDFLEFLEAVVRIALAFAVNETMLDQQDQQVLQQQSVAQDPDQPSKPAPLLSARRRSATGSRRGSFTVDGEGSTSQASARSRRGSFENNNNSGGNNGGSRSSRGSFDNHIAVAAQKALAAGIETDNEDDGHDTFDYFSESKAARKSNKEGSSSISGGAGGGEIQNYDIKLDINLDALIEKLDYVIHQFTKHRHVKKAEGKH
jgi:hypothetical protein